MSKENCQLKIEIIIIIIVCTINYKINQHFVCICWAKCAFFYVNRWERLGKKIDALVSHFCFYFKIEQTRTGARARRSSKSFYREKYLTLLQTMNILVLTCQKPITN